jgi:protein TonB
VLSAVIAKDGTVENLSLLSGHPLLVPAAMDAVKQWRYRPYTLNGQPVEVMTQIHVNFQLQ